MAACEASQMVPAQQQQLLPDFDNEGPNDWRSVRPAPSWFGVQVLEFPNIFVTNIAYPKDMMFDTAVVINQ